MPDPRASIDASANQSAGGCLARVLWMVAGNMVLALIVLSVARQPTWTLGVLDAFFWACILGLVLVRYVDVNRLHGRTAQGEPATMNHFRRYAAGLVTLGGAAWSAAQSVQL